MTKRLEDPQVYCPKCGEEYYHRCYFNWCVWPCNKYWGEKELEKYIGVYRKQVNYEATRVQSALMEFCGL